MIKPECERRLIRKIKDYLFAKGVTHPKPKPLGLQFMMENKSEPYSFQRAAK